jgi:dienelactone hydrolase
LRRFETILAFAALFAVGWPVVFGSRPRRGIVAATISVALLAQIQLEGFRWQMIPLYLVAVGLAVGDVFFLERRLEWSSRLLRGILGTVGLVFAAFLPVALPVPEIPAPSGPEGIGTMTVDLIDRARDEPYGERPGGPRELTAQVWYPAAPDQEGERAVWSLDWEVVAPAISRNIGMPSWFLGHTRYSLSHAVIDAPIAPGGFPVIVFSHGWQGVRTIAVNQAEHLASNGYIVIAPDHTYLAAATVLADGDVAYQDPAALPDPATVDAVTYQESATALVATMAADLVTVLDELDEGSGGAFASLAGSVDSNRIGIYGHTAGGGAAVKTCLEDERCDAVLGLDPWVEPLLESDLQLTMSRPALYMRSDEWVETQNDALLLGIAGRGSSVTYLLTVEGSTENDFTMTPLVSPLAEQMGLKGPIPAGRVVPIVDNYLLGFFDVFLLGTGSASLDSVSFPEVSVSVIDQS